MDNIIVISPDYLNACYTESIKYSFKFIGYGNSKKAKENLYKVNLNDVIGICYFADSFPEDKEELDDIENIFRLLSICDYSSKILIVVSSKNKIPVRMIKQYSNLSISYYEHNFNINDITINKHVFGSILLSKRSPYKLSKYKEEPQKEWDTPLLKYSTIIPNDLLYSIETVNTIKDIGTTIFNDEYLPILRSNKLRLAVEIRKAFIKAHFGIFEVDFLDNQIRECEDKNYRDILIVLRFIIKEKYDAKVLEYI